jgi:hypothetical protein
MICPNCQKDLMDDAPKCTGCGHEFALQPPSNAFAPDKTRAFQPSGNAAPPTKVFDENGPMAVTKVAFPREEMGSTKVHSDAGMAATKVAATQGMDATKIFGQPAKPKAFLGWLVVIAGNQQWQQFVIPLEEKRNTIGAGEDADFRLNEEGCELIHASLRVREGKLFVTDLDTTAGTFVHDQPISRAELQDGDEIRIASAVLRYRRL